jgi:hypothetical protein
MNIEFNPDEWYEPHRRQVVWFSAIDDEKVITCGVTIEALIDHLDAFADDPLPTFRTHRERIWSIAAHLIAKRRFEGDGTILIRSVDLAALATNPKAV